MRRGGASIGERKAREGHRPFEAQGELKPVLLQTVDTATGGEYRSRTEEFASERGEKGAMKILVIGGGGREHALAWKLGESKRVEKIWCAPGNGGIAQEAECVALAAGDVNAIVALAERLKPGLTVAGAAAARGGGAAGEVLE